MDDPFNQAQRIAYFTMEIALRKEIPTYSGGLGVLAGDTMRTAADLDLPMVAVSLVSRSGYFRQEIDANGRQTEHPQTWEPSLWATPLDARVSLLIENRRVWIGGWLYVIVGKQGGSQPVILLDTNLPENSELDRDITAVLYGGDTAMRLRQEIVLGIGGARMLHALGIHARQFHLNEGHAALLTLELLRRSAYPQETIRPGELRYDLPRVRQQCNFTTHTPVEAGHDRFPYDLVQSQLGDFVDLSVLKQLGGTDSLNLTQLALHLSEYVNGVAKRHAETSRKMFPGYQVAAITNGVHPSTWTAPPFASLYDAKLPGWSHEPELLARADCSLSDEAVWQAHVAAKAALHRRVHQLSGVVLDPGHITLGFARRMTSYKRPDLLFSNLPHLRELARKHPIQIVLAGKAHPHDEPGKRLIERLHTYIRELAGSVTVVFLPDYGMELAGLLVAGVDVWLNTPMRPLEASGTSGMKAAFNGVPSLSVLDGWWLEGCIEGVTGWAVGASEASGAPEKDADALYAKLQDVVLPLYYGDHAGWIAVMKGAIAKNASFFSSHRMMRRYASEAYLR